MRGKPSYTTECTANRGITPADAGKTQNAKENKSKTEDHPRGCGENSPSAFLCVRLTGSPPRMRGKHAPYNLDVAAKRITPADAGKTCK